MAQSQFGLEIERLAAEYDATLKAMTENPLFSRDRKRLVYTANSDSVALAERYEAARRNLAAAGICLESVLCAQPSSISSGATTGFERLDIRLMDRASTWAQGYYALRDACSEDAQAGRDVSRHTTMGVYRPLTFGENLRARITDARAHYNDITQTPSWSGCNDSCTAIIYGSDGKFKVEKVSWKLLDLVPYFKCGFIHGTYDAVATNNSSAMEFERCGIKYNEQLTQEEVLLHPFWQFIADGNTSQLQDFTQLQWAGKPAGYKGMAIMLCQYPQVGETRAL